MTSCWSTELEKLQKVEIKNYEDNAQQLVQYGMEKEQVL